MKRTREVTKDQLFEEFSTVVGETERLLRSVADAGSGKAEGLRASVEEGLAAAGDRLMELRAEALRQASAAARAADDYVHESPWRVVGIVAGLAAITGLVAGLLISHSRGSDPGQE